MVWIPDGSAETILGLIEEYCEMLFFRRHRDAGMCMYNGKKTKNATYLQHGWHLGKSNLEKEFLITTEKNFQRKIE